MCITLSFKHHFLSIFQIMFLAGFGTVLIMASFYSILIGDFPGTLRITFTLLVSVLIVLFFFTAAYRFLARFSEKGQKWIAGLIFLLMAVLELGLILYFHSMMPPLIDGGHTYAEALYLLEHRHASGNTYFQVYPNNIPVTVLRYLIYRFFAWFHFSSYMIIDRVFCGTILMLGIYFSWKLINDLFNRRMGNLFLLMTLTTLPFFFYTLYFYTDTTILMIPVLLLFLWHRYSQTGQWRYVVLLGLAYGLGYQIRPNLILFLPALVLYMLFTTKYKKAALGKAAVNLLIIAVLLAACGAVVHGYERYLGYHKNLTYMMPDTHWIMLGLSEDGGFNKVDYERTFRQPTQAAKKQVNLQMIKKRLDQRRLPGLTLLWGDKLARTWAMGGHGYYWYSEFTNQPSLAFDYLFGDKRQLIMFLIQVFYLVSLIFLIFSTAHFFRTKKITILLLIQLSLFGNLLFYTFIWEAEPRYSLLFTPYLLIAAMYGFAEYTRLLDRLTLKIWQRDLSGTLFRRLNIRLTSGLIFLLFLCGIANQFIITSPRAARDYLVDIPHAQGPLPARVSRGRMVSQTFAADGSYNRITLYVADKKGTGNYLMTLRNPETGEVLLNQSFSDKNMHVRHFHSFRIPPQRGIRGSRNQISLRQISGSPRARLDFKLNAHDRRDIYPKGHFSQNGKPMAKADLQFQVFDQHNTPLIPLWTYWSLITIPMLGLIAAGSLATHIPDRRSERRIVLRALRRKMNN